MFASPEIIEELEAIRHRLCQYGRDNVNVKTCDCKFYLHGSSNGEFSVCAELEYLIRHLKGETTLEDRLFASLSPSSSHKVTVFGSGATCNDCNWFYSPGCGHNAEDNIRRAASKHEEQTKPPARSFMNEDGHTYD